MGDPAQSEIDDADSDEGFSGVCSDDGLDGWHEGGCDGDGLDSSGFGSEDRFGLHGIWRAVSK